MKMSEKLKELRAKSIQDLKLKKLDLLKEEFNIRMQKGTGQLKQNHLFKSIRRDIARINTIIFEN